MKTEPSCRGHAEQSNCRTEHQVAGLGQEMLTWLENGGQAGQEKLGFAKMVTMCNMSSNCIKAEEAVGVCVKEHLNKGFLTITKL